MKRVYLRTLVPVIAFVTSLSAGATAVTNAVPASQEAFDAEWFEIKSETASSWEWVDATPNYAQVHPEYDYTYSSRNNGQCLFYATGIEMKAGDEYTLSASVTTSDYNDDNAFRFVYTTDRESYTVIDSSDITIWNQRGTDVVFTTKTSSYTLTVPEDGTYYLGIISRGGNNKATGYLKVASITYEKKVDYPSKVTGLNITRPESAELKAELTWTWPTKSDAGAALEGVNAHVYRSDSSTFNTSTATLLGDVEGTPGEPGSYTDETVPEPGEYYYHVQTYYGEGTHPSTQYKESPWIGEDVKLLNILAKNCTLEMEGNGFKINFEKRLEGYNKGWIDTDQVYIKIMRQKNSEDKVLLTDTYQGESPYIDEELEGPGNYTYYLYQVYKGVDSAECKVGPAYGGGTETVPFFEDFSDSSALDNFTVLGDSSYYKWSRNYSGYLQFSTSNYYSYKTSLLTPPIALEAGKTYKVSCVSWVDEDSVDDDDDYGYGYTSSDTAPVPEDLVFTAGKAASYDGQTVIDTVNINKGSSDKMTPEVYFSPAESGNYYFGFQAEFTNSNKLYLDDISITESEILPADVADFSAVADAEGAKEVAISFTIPATSNAGLALSSLSSVTVTRLAEGDDESEEVKVLEGEDCQPGAAVSFVDEVPVENNYSYTVVVALNDKLSNPVSSEMQWVGYDYPKNVSQFTISLGETEDGEAKVSWSELSGTTLGKHGGYVDAENLKYRIYRVVGGGDNDPQVYVGETQESPYVDAEMVSLPWNRYRYGVSAVNGEMEGDVIISNNTRTMGDAIELPYEPDMSDENEILLWDTRGFLTDNDALACYNRGEIGSSNFYAMTPPFHSIDSDKPAIDLDMTLARGSVDYEEALEVYAVNMDADSEETLLTTVIVDSAVGETQTETLNLDLPSVGRYRIKLRMASEYNSRLEIRSLKLDNDNASAIKAVSVEDIRYDAATAKVLLGENIVSAKAYAVNGMAVASVRNASVLDLSATTSGVYILRAVTNSGDIITHKLYK